MLEAPLGSKIGYHELDDEKENADEEWMTGEASQVSGGGTRGSRNWVLKVMLPILVRGLCSIVAVASIAVVCFVLLWCCVLLCFVLFFSFIGFNWCSRSPWCRFW